MDGLVAGSKDRVHKRYLENLTIVVPTYGRPHHVMQTVDFWHGRGPKLLILDGSPTPIKDENLFCDMEDLTYVHLPESFQSRLAYSSKWIQTDYVTLMADDEVHMPSSLAASITELAANPELASCLGWSVGFKPIVSNGSIVELHGFPGYPGLKFLDNNHETSRERLILHFGQYQPSNVYSVVRADAYANAIRLTGLPGDRVGGQFEIEYELAILYQGGNRSLANLHWLRNLRLQKSNTRDPDTIPEKLFFKCFLSPEYLTWKNEFLSSRSHYLASIDGQKATQVRVWLEEALQLYSERAESLSARTLAKDVSFFLRKCAHPFVPLLHRHTVRRFIKLALHRVPDPSLQEFVKDLSLSGMTYSQDELSQVIKERFQRE